MTEFLNTILDKVIFDPRSVHYNKRKFDGMFEVVARAEVEGVWREVALDVQPNRTKALESVRILRGHDNG
nr:MAG TPA: hypothetical protein [Caudoviricetes sp.]